MNPTLPVLPVYRRSEGYIVDYRHTPEAARIFDLFETYEIPAAFRAIADPERVRVALQTANPEYHVRIIDTL